MSLSSLSGVASQQAQASQAEILVPSSALVTRRNPTTQLTVGLKQTYTEIVKKFYVKKNTPEVFSARLKQVNLIDKRAAETARTALAQLKENGSQRVNASFSATPCAQLGVLPKLKCAPPAALIRAPSISVLETIEEERENTSPNSLRH